jgi:plastocyanin
MRKLLAISISIVLGAVLAGPAVGSTTKNVRVGNDLAFHPHKLKIHTGTTVVWKWDGGLTHNVTVIKGPVKFHSKDMMSGTYTHVFSTKGTYHLMCTIHGFKMTIKVK